ncbi:MAG: Hpt domain-containing protein, partial [Pseudomonadota bacterium]
MVDLSRFKDTYFQECGELLGEIEELLLGCVDETPDGETLNALFRAVHSIKGGGGAFGFTALVGLAHPNYTLLDQIGAGRTAPHPHAKARRIKARDAL